jgi:hypothetical protein
VLYTKTDCKLHEFAHKLLLRIGFLDSEQGFELFLDDWGLILAVVDDKWRFGHSCSHLPCQKSLTKWGNK